MPSKYKAQGVLNYTLYEDESEKLFGIFYILNRIKIEI